jgi:hypothetical protein
MTRYLPKVKERKVKNLLNKMSEGSEDVQEVSIVLNIEKGYLTPIFFVGRTRCYCLTLAQGWQCCQS